MQDLRIALPEGKVELVESRKENKKDPSQNLIYYPAIIFTMGFFKSPFLMVINAYFPMLMLSLLGLMIFKQDADTGERIANISVILLAYIAFIPTVRSIVPQVTYFTLADAILFFNFLGTGVLMLETAFLEEHTK